MSDRLTRNLWAAVFLAVLVASIPYDLGKSLLPFYRFWGVDFQNLYAFHHCELRNEPYAHPQAAEICHDAVKRPMRYPPLLYWSFLWTRPFSYPVALRMWVMFILIGTYLGITCFLDREALGQRRIQLFVGLLFAQFPALYAIERANNDVWIVLLWGLAYLFFRRRQYFTAGALAGLAAVAKVYPAFAAIVVVIAVAQDRRAATRFVAGMAAAGAGVCLLFARSTLTYVRVLREFAGEMPEPSIQSHGLPAFFSPLAVVVLGGSLFFFWTAAGRRLHRAGQHDLLFAGALAIATFFSTTSNDYNLITVYPLMALLFVRSLRPDSALSRIALVGLLVMITGPRILFLGQEHRHLGLQVLVLVVAAGAAMRAAAKTLQSRA